jgi:hypothetical protein
VDEIVQLGAHAYLIKSNTRNRRARWD